MDEEQGAPARVTNPDKVLFPEAGHTKKDLVSYYAAVSRWLLPYLAERPLTLQRWPDGIHGFSFFEKQVPRGAPSFVETVALPSSGKRGMVSYPLCNDARALAYFANLAAITLHVWTSRRGSLDAPDYVLFDLDTNACTLGTLAKVAVELRARLEALGLRALVKSTGGTGLHVLVPLAPVYGYDDVRAFAEAVARALAKAMPREVTIERTVAKRPEGTVYLDWVQVGKGKTIVPPFVVRAHPKAPVSMPLAWEEVEAWQRRRTRDPTIALHAYTLATAPRLLLERGDPWAKEWRPQRWGAALEKALGGHDDANDERKSGGR